MLYINSIIFGIVQGITEFLPISSSGHLVILHKLINLPIQNELVFDVALHLATLFAVIVFFWQDIWSIMKSWISSLRGKGDEKSRLGWLIILATVPAAMAGFFFEDIIDNVLRSTWVVALMLVLVALLFIFVEKKAKHIHDLSVMNFKNALIIGCSQALALIPGTSRSGITIIAGLSLGLKRVEAIRFSFLLSLPIILGANIKKIPLILNGNFQANEMIVLLIAFLFAFLAGFLAIKFFLRFASKHTLNIFAYYRIALALIIVLFLL